MFKKHKNDYSHLAASCHNAFCTRFICSLPPYFFYSQNFCFSLQLKVLGLHIYFYNFF